MLASSTSAAKHESHAPPWQILGMFVDNFDHLLVRDVTNTEGRTCTKLDWQNICKHLRCPSMPQKAASHHLHHAGMYCGSRKALTGSRQCKASISEQGNLHGATQRFRWRALIPFYVELTGQPNIKQIPSFPPYPSSNKSLCADSIECMICNPQTEGASPGDWRLLQLLQNMLDGARAKVRARPDLLAPTGAHNDIGACVT